MANVAVRSSNKASSASATSITVNAPSGTTTGDLVVCAVACNGEITLSDGNGGTPFTKDTETVETANDSTFAIFSRRIVGGDPSSYTFTKSGGITRMSAVAIAFSNPNGITIYDPSAPSSSTHTVNGSSTSNVTQAITTTVNNSIHCIVAMGDGTTTITPPTGDGYTEEQQSTEQPVSFCTKTITPAGDTGTHTFSYSFSVGNISQSFAIRNSAGFTITASGGGYNSTGLAATLRVGSYTYLRHRK